MKKVIVIILSLFLLNGCASVPGGIVGQVVKFHSPKVSFICETPKDVCILDSAFDEENQNQVNYMVSSGKCKRLDANTEMSAFDTEVGGYGCWNVVKVRTHNKNQIGWADYYWLWLSHPF